MTAPAAPALDPRHIGILARFDLSNPRFYVEADNAQAPFATLRAMERRGLVRTDWKIQNGLRAPWKRYRVAYITDAGRAAIEAHLAEIAEQNRAAAAEQQVTAERDDVEEHHARAGRRWDPECPLPGGWCDPDVDHDHDEPTPGSVAAAVVDGAAEAPVRTPEQMDAVELGAEPDDVCVTCDHQAQNHELPGARCNAGELCGCQRFNPPGGGMIRGHRSPGAALRAAGARYRAALAADRPSGEPCPHCTEIHASAEHERDCHADTPLDEGDEVEYDGIGTQAGRVFYGRVLDAAPDGWPGWMIILHYGLGENGADREMLTGARVLRRRGAHRAPLT